MLTHQLVNCLLAVLCISLVECLPPKQVLDLAAQKWRENPDQDLINRYGADAYSRYVSIEPINEERISMLKELFQAIFVPAKTTGSKVGSSVIVRLIARLHILEEKYLSKHLF